MVAAILDKLEVRKLFEASRKPDAAVAFYGTKNVLQSSVEKIHFYFFIATTIFIFVEGFRKKIRSNCKCFYAPEGTSGGILKSHRPSVRQSVRPLQTVSQRYLIKY